MTADPKKPGREAGKITKISMEARRSTYEEVSRGFTEEEALKEATRCIQCKNPGCVEGCPAGIDVKGFIDQIKDGDFQGAVDTIKKNNSLPGVCGRVCPQEDQCQAKCIFHKKGSPIQIGYLERFVADWELARGPSASRPAPPVQKTHKVAVIGAGPAGLTCAADLAREGFDVHLFEALHKAGGVLIYGIPEFRLPKDIVAAEVDYVRSLGVTVETNVVAGKSKTLDDLRAEGFKAFFIGVGAGLPRRLGIPGENLNGIYSSNEFLTRINLMKGYRFPDYDTPVPVGKRVGVFGAGNVALDSARSALRLGAEEVSVIYRRTKDEIPAREEEIENAEEEGIRFLLLASPKEFLGDAEGSLKGVVCLKNKLGDPDASGRRSPIVIPGSEFTVDIDTAVVAVGTTANPLLLSTIPGMEFIRGGYVKVNEDLQTSVPDVFAGGDIVSGSATVISAIQQAKVAAAAIKKYLR